jgi:hypothetical protein
MRMSDTTEILGSATNMAATGVGLGIMTMGAMLPLSIMKNMSDNIISNDKSPLVGISKNISGSKGVAMNMPKIQVPIINLDHIVKPIKRGKLF